MLKQPTIADEIIIRCLQDSYGLSISSVKFLPLGHVTNAIYDVAADNGTHYFLKLRQGEFDANAVAVSAYLHAQGIQPVIAPIMTLSQALWVQAHGFYWTLYPYFDGKTGFERPLSQSHWIALGKCMRRIHQVTLPDELARTLPQETLSPRWRDGVKTFLQEVPQTHYTDPIAARFAAFWMTRSDEIQRIVDRAEQLAQQIQQRNIKLVVCHSDLHGRNVLTRAEDEVAIVDWDEPILAPRERDLMFIGGGIGAIWNDAQETAWFYQGYGEAEIDLAALAYYRYERIVVDLAEIAERIFGIQGSVEDRQKGLRISEQFQPNNVVDIAHRTYQRLLGSEGSGRKI